jgi:hypothetical protein
MGQSFVEFWPLGSPAALDLDELTTQLPLAAIEEAADGLSLSLETET